MNYLAVIITLMLQATVALSGPVGRPFFISDEIIAGAATVVNACQTEHGVATADIEAVRNGTWPNSRPLKCYMYCLWEQFGLVDDKRELNLNGMLTFFHRIPAYRAEVQRAVRECKEIGNGDNCQYAYTFNMCYAKISPQVPGTMEGTGDIPEKTYYLF